MVNKHVTIACDSCRRRRRKCNGQVPCPLCSRTGETCIYTSVDRRWQRHDGYIDGEPPYVQQPTNATVGKDTTSVVGNSNEDGESQRSSIAVGIDNSVTQQKRKHNSDSPGRCGAPKLQKLAVREAHVSHTNDDSGRSAAFAPSKIRTMKDMQGRFGVRDGTMQHLLETDLVRFPPRKILPKDLTSAYGVDSQDGDGMPNKSDSQQRSHQLVWRGARTGYAVPGYTRAFGNLPLSSSITANGYSDKVQCHQALNFSIPDHFIFPIVDIDESPLGRAITDFRQLGARLIARGTPLCQVADQGLIDVTLFFRERLPEDPVNASTWASEMLRAFRGTFSDRLLLACAVCVGSLMRWFLAPTPERYAQVPSIVRPTRLQRLKPHPPWVDVMIFPSFRNALVDRLRDWVEPCMEAGWDLLWSRPLEQALFHDARTQQIFLTPEFAVYIDNPKRWLMRKSILEEFSEIQGSEIIISEE